MTDSYWKDDDPYITEIVTKSCELLARYATEAAPPGVEAWGNYAFEVVAPFEVEFLIALVAFGRDSSDENRLCLRAAIADVVDAWEKVARMYDPRRMYDPCRSLMP